MGHLEDLRGEFPDHDTVLHLLLGLVSMSGRLDRVLPMAPDSVPENPPPLSSEEEERRVMLLLGLLSLRRTLMGALEPLRATQPAPQGSEPSAASAEVPRLRDLLR